MAPELINDSAEVKILGAPSSPLSNSLRRVIDYVVSTAEIMSH